jgi:hypothetical protein
VFGANKVSLVVPNLVVPNVFEGIVHNKIAIKEKGKMSQENLEKLMQQAQLDPSLQQKLAAVPDKGELEGELDESELDESELDAVAGGRMVRVRRVDSLI